ncbi:DNA alkylation repair protein [Mucilaginibacter sp. X5P1]|uniref:DNA alkylation repair protein n=1 Tax=Mucilaginibacter sp. X5P1 TaxID=2723088 RepID=UPI00161D1B42|nr:DNA alkylation repair protein [Mucilaginibacter sp. X5P1]MBB6140420.1 3-methyladenine DNA glycosylase AlkD [Mucilaginibacter sp. X5P1]
MILDEIIDQLKQKSNPAYHAGMLRFGVDNSKALGVPIPELRKLAKSLKKNHQLALQLWDTGIHEARILASMVDDPALVTQTQMDNWVKDFYAWDLCDQVCGNLFDRTPFAIEKALFYTTHQDEYIKRAGFVLMAEYAVHNKTADNDVFIALLPIIDREAWDDRNFVKKAVNWALRQIGKRNKILCAAAIASARRILLQDSKTAKWIAANALKSS